MSRKRWIAASIGLAAGAGLLFVLRPITHGFLRDSAFFINPRLWLVWVMLLGAAVTGLVVAGLRWDPLVTAVPAALIFLVFLPVFIDLSVPSWYPNWVRWRVLGGFGLLPYAIVGILTMASMWPAIERRWMRTEDRPSL